MHEWQRALSSTVYHAVTLQCALLADGVQRTVLRALSLGVSDVVLLRGRVGQERVRVERVLHGRLRVRREGEGCACRPAS